MSDNQNVTSRKLIDRLLPNPTWGPMQGIFGTTYELGAEFLELDFLPSVFGLGARSTWATRIAIEKRLRELDTRAVILTEARRYRNRPRSLQLEVLPAVSPRGSSLHAKVTLLVFDRAVRLIVGSANLTEPGYRQNREGVAVLTASKGSPKEAVLISQALNGAEGALSSWLSDDARKIIRRGLDTVRPWVGHSATEDSVFAWSYGQVKLWRTFLDRWPAGEPVRRLSILSPFWSQDAGITLKAFLAEMARMGILAAQSEIRLLTDAYQGPNGEVMPILPPGYANYDWAALGVIVTAQAVSPKVHAEELGGMEGFTGRRDLHAKIVLLEGVKNGVAYLGSANFTAHGWGFLGERTAANVEAGLILRSGVTSAMLEGLVPDLAGDPVLLNKEHFHALMAPENGPGEDPWPEFISQILLSPVAGNENELELIIKVTVDRQPASWSAKLAEKEGVPGEVLFDFPTALKQKETSFAVSIPSPTLTRLLVDQEVWICWNECPSGRAVPINVASSARDRLPVTPQKNIDETHLISYYQGKISWEDLFPDPDPPTDTPASKPISRVPENAVDKSRIQSYQIREFVEALAGIRDDLRAATQSERSMQIALSGAVSPLALAYTVVGAAESGCRTPTAAAFQLVEILGCLKAARVFEVPEKLSTAWRQSLAGTGNKIAQMLKQLISKHAEAFDKNKAFRHYQSAVLRVEPRPEI